MTDLLASVAVGAVIGLAVYALPRTRLWGWLLDDAPPPPIPKDGRTLPWTFLRRTIRPYALAVSVACGVVFWSMITESGVGNTLDGIWGKAIGGAAGLTSFMLWVGWWAQWKRWMDQGLLLSAAVWAAVSAVILMEGSSWPSGLLAFAWALASGGAWLLEVNDKGRR